jgi:16S rRNA U1498 N3-methylase RsmE
VFNGFAVVLCCVSPRLDLVLALQAPIRLERMLPHISSLGVRRLIITAANKVERGYWGSHLIRTPVSRWGS